jgi:hypothetical protein
MPDFILDSLDGQAHIYYLGSAYIGGAISLGPFYREFEQNYDVDPVVRVVDGRRVTRRRVSE